MFSRMYLEITTCCNLSCSFCPGTKRPAAFLSPEDFRTLAAKLRPYGQYLYLHVMGEPLLHPQLPELLEICRALGFRATLTTNGTLLPKKQAALLDAPALRKVSISLHSFEANEAGDFSAYLTGCTDFAHAAKKSGILTDFRLWNLDGAQTKGLHDRNAEILAHLHAAFPGVWQKNTWGWRLEDGVFVSFGERFDWPDEQAAERGSQGRCRALSDQIAVLSDGTVVRYALPAEFFEMHRDIETVQTVAAELVEEVGGVGDGVGADHQRLRERFAHKLAQRAKAFGFLFVHGKTPFGVVLFGVHFAENGVGRRRGQQPHEKNDEPIDKPDGAEQLPAL